MFAESGASTFIQLFNRLEQTLDRMNHSTKHLGFRRLVEELSRSNQLINTFKVDLIELLELRNAIVHKSTNEPIAEPHPDAVAKLDQMVQILTNPPKATEIAAKPVYTTTTQSQLIEVIKVMNQNSFTSIPIYHDDRFVGVLSESSVTKWLANQSITQTLSLQNILVGQLQDFFDQADDKHNSYQFFPENADVFTVRKAFVSFTREKKRMGAIFLTAHGVSSEKITGIITVWDLHKMSHWQLNEPHDVDVN